MKYSRKDILEIMNHPDYPKSSKYNPDWILENSIGSHCLWLQESLTQAMKIDRRMKILDLGCGKAISSIFLAKEFGANIYAVDLNVDPTENLRRIQDMDCENTVCPLQADARNLPFAKGYFDALSSINSIFMYVTDAHTLEKYVLNYVKPEGQIGVILPGFLNEYDNNYPEAYRPFLQSDNVQGWHSLEWWVNIFEQTQTLDILTADYLENNTGSEIYSKSAMIYNEHEHPFNVAAKDDYTFMRIVAKVKDI